MAPTIRPLACHAERSDPSRSERYPARASGALTVPDPRENKRFVGHFPPQPQRSLDSDPHEAAAGCVVRPAAEDT
jgi:hypothetical protein